MAYHSKKSASQKITGFLFVVLFHVALIYGLAVGLGRSVVEIITGPIQTKIIEELPVVEEKEPPPPPPKLEQPPAYIPPPEMDIAPEPEPIPEQKTAIAVVQSKAPAPSPPPVPEAVVVQAKADPRNKNKIPPYPASSRRMNEQGVVQLSLYILEDGSVGDAKVEKSSGFPRLDSAAVKHALRAWRFLPATKNSTAFASWISINVRFKLE